MPAPFPSSKNYTYTYGSEGEEDPTENEAHSEVPSVPVAELKGHGDGPIHIVRFTGEIIQQHHLEQCPETFLFIENSYDPSDLQNYLVVQVVAR